APPPPDPPIDDRAVVVSPPATPDRPDVPKHPERPQVPGQPIQSQQMKDLVRDFQVARQAFLKQQRELKSQLHTADDAQRAIIREQLKENLHQWLEQQKAQIQELKDQAKEMNRVSNLREVLEAGKGEGHRPGK